MGGSSAAEKDPKAFDSAGSGRDRLGGARADFVANLGRRRAEMRGTLDALREEPASRRARDELRRRVHALGAGAKLLRFTRLAEELHSVEERLHAAGHRGSLDDADFGAIQDLVGRMTSLAWGQDEGAAPKVPVVNGQDPEPCVVEAPVRAPVSVLVIGPATIADALTLPAGRSIHDGTPPFEIERTAKVAESADIARALAPDVIVIDGDMAGARLLVETLVNDTLTEGIPIVVCVRIARPEDAGPFLALGVAKALPKPVSPSELRRTCASVVATYVRHEISREPLGEIDVDALGARLAEELRRGLCDTLDPQARGAAVSLGEGTEVLAALWGAVARIRDVVTIRSQGRVRFALGGPEGALPMASWLEDGTSTTAGNRTSIGRAGRARSEASLDKTRILVADDDAAICWFLAGVLKTAGATVYEARDGERALEIAKSCEPDIIISDILMPKMDGFALCRALKRDLVLRDIPIVLLSWKEDLLQRVRELGADADGYLRKEASAGAIVQRVRELVHARGRVATRLATTGEVRGRLDGLTTFSLLKFACQHRPASSVTVRDASYLYEVEIRGGRPARATRTSLSGTFERGSSVLAALLGVGDGRFVVTPPQEDEEVGPIRVDLAGTLPQQLAPVIASARAAVRLLTGTNLACVHRIEIDEDVLEAYWIAAADPARAIVRELAAGASPRSLIASGRVSSRLVEDVLVDAAIHGSVIQILDGQGVDHLPGATARELALLRGDRSAHPIASLPLPTASLETPAGALPLTVTMPSAAELMRAALKPLGQGEGAPPDVAKPAAFEPWPPRPTEADLASQQAEAFDEAAAELDDPWFGTVDVSSSSLGAQEEHEYPSPLPPSGPRSLTPPPPALTLSLDAPAVRVKTPLPALMSARELTPTPSSLPIAPGLKPMLTLGSLHPPPVELVAAPPPPALKPKNTKKSPKPSVVTDKGDRSPVTPDVTPKFQMPSAFLPRAVQLPPVKDRKTLYWVLFALVGVTFAVWARWSRDAGRPTEAALMAEMQPGVSGAPEQVDDGEAPSPQMSEPTQTQSAGEPRRQNALDEIVPEDLPLRDHDKVRKGQGLLEIVTGKSDTVYLDGKAVGSGPVIAIPLRARKEPYVVRVKMREDERSRSVTVKDQRLVRLRMAPPWQR